MHYREASAKTGNPTLARLAAEPVRQDVILRAGCLPALDGLSDKLERRVTNSPQDDILPHRFG